MKKRLIFLVFIFLVTFPLILSAQQEYTVVKGDTLYRIAQKHNLSVGELKRLNNLSSNTIQPGQHLLLSAVQTDTAEIHIPAVASTYRTENVYHLIRRGDTLLSIAQKYGLSVEELKKFNNLKSNRIIAGDRLLIRKVSTRVSTPDEPVLEVADNLPEKIEAKEGLGGEEVAASLLEVAKSFIGVPYRFGGFSRSGIDCSGLVKKAFASVGVELPRTARTQFKEGEKVTLDEIMPGDLLFFATRAASPTHVAIYLGDGLILHASSSMRKVVIASFEGSSYFKKRFIGARRILSPALLNTRP